MTHDRHSCVELRLQVHPVLVALLILLICAPLSATAQTTASIGYPDPRYSTTKTLAKFSCTGGARNCPDGGEYVAAGGNLTVTIVAMRNLPDLDGFGLAGLQTDAYVRVSIGDNVRESGVVWNSLNPEWPPCLEKGCVGETDTLRDLNFGFRPAGTEIVVEVLDKDSGFEFGDDLIATVTVNAIYCSSFTAITQDIPSADDSAWKMPQQPLCVEEMWLPLVADGTCDVEADGVTLVSTSTTPCMRLRMTALPFRMRTEQVYLTGIVVSGGMGGYFPDEDSWLYGRVYSASNARMLSYYRMDRSKGGLLVRSDSASNNNKGNVSLTSGYGYAPYARVTFNYDAEVFVFRRVDDAASQPEWLNTTFGWAETREYAQLKDVAGNFRAVAMNVSAHAINEYGDAFGTGLVTGANLRQNYTDSTLSMYFIIAAPHESFDVISATYSKEFSWTVFAQIMTQFALNLLFLGALAVRFLKRMHWRLDRVESFLAEKVALTLVTNADQQDKSTPTKKTEASAAKVPLSRAGPRPDIVAQLFFCHKKSAHDLAFRLNLFYATASIYLILASPLLIMVSWGVTTILLVTPPAFGFGIVFLGLGSVGGVYGAVLWVRMGWRMTSTVLRLFGAAFVFAFVFLFSATFADPKVFVGGENVDFFSLTYIFLTLNMMPIIWIAFTNDSKLMKSLSQVVAVVGASKKVNTLKSKFKNLGTLGLKLAANKQQASGGDSDLSSSAATANKRSRKLSVFAPLLGDNYSVEQSIPGFAHADILTSAFVTPAETKQATNRRLYGYALGVLAVYCVVALSRSAYPTQSLGVVATVVLVDSCVYMLHRGHLAWSPGYIVLLLSAARVCLVATCGDYWLLGHALLYMVVGTALCKEITGKNLPRMSKQEAGGVAFFGHEYQQWRHLDVSTTPEFVLGVLLFFYVFLLLAVAFGSSSDSGETAMIRVPIVGQEWALWVFGVLAFVVVLFVGLSLATSRAFFLQREQLLSDYAMRVYLFVRGFTLPFMLAAASEVLVICAGLFVFASTGSTFILVTSIFSPLILMLSLAVYVQWRKNDFGLVIWPPEDDEEDILDDDDDDDLLDEEAALEKEAAIMREAFVLPPLRGKGNNSIYDSGDESFKMPALPPKSRLNATLATALNPAKRRQQDVNDDDDTSANGMAKRPLLGRGLHNSSRKASTTKAKVKGRGASSSELGASKAKLPAIAEAGKSVGDAGLLPTSQAAGPASVGRGGGGSIIIRMARHIRDGVTRVISWQRSLLSKKARQKYRQVPTSPSQRQHQHSQPLLLLPVDSPTNGAPSTNTEKEDADAFAAGDADFAAMTLYDAYQQGFLLPQDYMTLGCFASLLVLLVLYGAVLSATETPAWMGQLLWVAAYVLLFSLAPTAKYFQVGSATTDMRFAYGASYLLAWITGAVLFGHVLHGNVNTIESLVILSFLVLYPAFLLLAIALGQWNDEGWVRPPSRALQRAFALGAAAIVLFLLEMFVFASVALGAALLVALALALFLLFFLLKWVENDRYLAPRYERRANIIVAAATNVALVAGLLLGLLFFSCLSIVFAVLVLKYALLLGAAYWQIAGSTASGEVALFYSPYLFPVFSYDAYRNNVRDETPHVLLLYVVLLLVFCWGVSGVMFVDPLGVGVGLCSISLLVFAGAIAHLCAVTPVQMGITAKYVNDMILQDASSAAQLLAEQRRTPLTLECAEFVERELRERKAELEFQAIAYGGRAGGGGRNKAANAVGKSTSDEDSNKEKQAPRKSGGDLAMEIDELERTCGLYNRRQTGGLFAGIAKLRAKRTVRLGDGSDTFADGQASSSVAMASEDTLLTWQDAAVEIFQGGGGPLGFLYAFTLPWRLAVFLAHKYNLPAWVAWCRSTRCWRALRKKTQKPSEAAGETALVAADPAAVAPAATEDVDQLEAGTKATSALKALVKPTGNAKKDASATSEKPDDLVTVLRMLPTLDAALDAAFYEETRCIIHFQLLLLAAADARLNREKVLFQKFLRENRFKLMSNGIHPPANVFRTRSFASIDVPLVAVWLLSLSREDRARFHALKAAFNTETERVDALVDAEDQRARAAQLEWRASWRDHDEQQTRRRLQEFEARRLRRHQQGEDDEQEQGKGGDDAGKEDAEALRNAQEAMAEIASGYSCVPGSFGRALQFVDREFPPDATSLAGCAHADEVAPEWLVSSGINVAAGLFDGGTDPDDVRSGGRLDDSWLLSAISIVAASGGVDDGAIDPLLDRIFVTKQTSLTGAYALRLYKNCQWHTIILDDFFPVAVPDGSQGNNTLAIAPLGSSTVGQPPQRKPVFACSRDAEEIWVALLEKAFAKYHGGYAALEGAAHFGGDVPGALEALTGCVAEEVFLAPAARGALKTTLWQQLLRFRANGFLLGAATLASGNADASLLDMGLVFGACYVLYDVREVDGQRLVKLHNPPGDHPEWKGDWSDGSKLWTRRLRRLRRLLGVQQHESADDNTFWMHFDDFCHAFRSLYVCRYYDPAKWTTRELFGRWTNGSTTSSTAAKPVGANAAAAPASVVEVRTARGLPTRHNSGCELESNPQFSLEVTRPTELIVTLTQVDARGLAPLEPLPVVLFIVSNCAADRAVRVKQLTRDNVVAHSGAPVRQREVRVHCTELPARTYTVLVAAYKKGMEGSFRVRVQSNYPVGFSPLWPAMWKTGGAGSAGAGGGGAPMTMAEKVAARVKETVADSTAVAKLLEKKNELVEKLAAGTAVVDSALRDDQTLLEEELAKQQKQQQEEEEEHAGGRKKDKSKKPKANGEQASNKPKASPWVEQWDAEAGKPFYFNKQSGVSTWDKPDDL